MKILGSIISLASGFFALGWDMKHPEYLDVGSIRWVEYVAFMVLFLGFGAGTLFRETLGCPGDGGEIAETSETQNEKREI